MDVKGVLVEETTIQQFFNMAFSISIWKSVFDFQVFQLSNKDNIIRMQRSFINSTGNTRGKYKNKRTTSWDDVDNQLLPKRKKK